MSKEMKTMINGNTLTLTIGDITKERTDAIVNAANGTLLGGGGVDGAIHRAAGKELLEECKQIRREWLKGAELPTGEAVLTKGYGLPAKYVIHTVGPIWYGGGQGEAELLAKSYQNCQQLALEKGLQSLAFPSISTGAYRYPIEEASVIAINTVADFLQKNQLGEVKFVLFSEQIYEQYKKALDTLLK